MKDIGEFKILVGGNFSRIPPMIARAIEIIRKLPDKTLINTSALARMLNRSPNSVRDSCWAIPKNLTAIHRGKKIYGNAKTIKAFKKCAGIHDER